MCKHPTTHSAVKKKQEANLDLFSSAVGTLVASTTHVAAHLEDRVARLCPSPQSQAYVQWVVRAVSFISVCLDSDLQAILQCADFVPHLALDS